jgi:phage baseplate assembly protein W
MSHIAYPFRIDQRGRTAESSYDGHIRDLIYQLLMTAPGERVNRPDFGSGLLQLTFHPNSDEVASATQFLVQGALQEWLGDLIEIDAVSVDNTDSRLSVTVDYRVRRTQEQRQANFTVAGGP